MDFITEEAQYDVNINLLEEIPRLEKIRPKAASKIQPWKYQLAVLITILG